MLWKKGWYETRTRLLFPLAVVVAITILTMSGSPPPPEAGLGPLVGATTIPAMFAAILLAGAGVKTQLGGLQRSKGLHGSMYYTLSLPVKRTRLFSVRVSLGLAETAGILVLTWAALLLVHLDIPPDATQTNAPILSDMFKQGVVTFCCVTAVYSLGVFFAAFLDDVYQHWATIITVVGTAVILIRVPLPASMQTFLVLSLASPLNTHTMPWTAMAVLLGLSGMLLLIALKIVRSLEY